jgi:UDPglucose--hexose-1-phosphate uridylyltransferase
MPVRRQIITGEPILFAPERAGRPNTFGRRGEVVCPFCPGHEDETPPEIFRAGDPWRVRVFPNKYPAVEGHEIIVESWRHDETFDRLENAAEVIETFISRYAAHNDAPSVSLFRNHGERAGASIDHLHSQLMPLSFVPPRVEREAAAFARAARCPLCSTVEVVIDQTPAFTWVAPFASLHAYQQWIVPRRHISEMTQLTEIEVAELALLLRRSTRATTAISTSHNLVFVNFRRQAAAHFYVDFFPRMTAVAGFELGSGTFIDIIDPAAAARVLRNASAL